MDVQPEDCVIGLHWNSCPSHKHTHSYTAGHSSGHPGLKISWLLELDSDLQAADAAKEPKAEGLQPNVSSLQPYTKSRVTQDSS